MTPDYEAITIKQFDSYARRCERANLKQYAKSLTAGSIANRAQPYILECQGEDVLIIKPGWRDAMKSARIEEATK